MISKSQFRLLSHLIEMADSDAPMSTLADSLDWSSGHTSRVVSELEAYGCVQTETRGRRKVVSLTDIKPIEELEELITEYSHVDLPELIAGSGLRILYYLDQSRTATEIAERSDTSRATVYRRLDDLQQVGIIGKSTSQYQLNTPFTTLSSIARGLYHHKHRREARQYTGGISIQWETHDEYLFTCDSDIDAEGFYLTGPALFDEFDIPLLTRERRHYIRSDRLSEVTPAELVCHTLLIDDGPRYRTYCLLLIQKHEIKESTLRRRADHYQHEAEFELYAIVDELIKYLDTEGETTADQLPEWEEFKRTAADYEINL